MNIKINIKDCDCQPTVITKKQISQVQFKKKNMLYAPPTKGDKSLKNSAKRNPLQQSTTTNNRQSRQPQESRYSPQPIINEQAERKFIDDMSKISKNNVTSDMIQNTNQILQRQNQILEDNQRTIHHMLLGTQSNNVSRERQIRQSGQIEKAYKQAADKIARQFQNIQRMKDQIIEYKQNLKRTSSEGNRQINTSQGSNQIRQMSSNLKNMVQLSKNHMQGLQNLQGIKSLQNFNMQAYTQSINTLKKQIVQYQKQSQTIERQLKLRAAKLQKLQISPNFDQQLLQPYQQHLKKKADSIDLHSIKDKVYQKLGVFDYGKFETDVCGITNQIKNEMNDFYIICKQYRIEIPDIKIDKKQLKQLDLKLPSVLDQYKASMGIVFTQRNTAQDEKKIFQTKKSGGQGTLAFTSKQKLSQSKNILKRTSPKQQQIGEIYTKPIDLSKNTKLTRTDQQKPRTVLETSQQKQRKQVTRNIKNIKKSSTSPDDEFEKYLENRAKQQLATIYQEKKKKLEQMQKQLYNKCVEQPKFQLTMNIKNKVSPKKIISNQLAQKEEQYGEDFQQQSQRHQSPKQQRNIRKQQGTKQTEQIKNIGTQVLRQKLKNLFSKNPQLNEPNIHHNRLINQQPQGLNVQANQLTNIAQGFISMINNTLTQVNTQLSQSIQKKMQNKSFSQQKRPEYQRRSSPNKIAIPRLQQFRAPPVFNMQMVYEPSGRVKQQKKQQKKIVAKDYEYLRIQQQNNELQISSMSNDDY